MFALKHSMTFTPRRDNLFMNIFSDKEKLLLPMTVKKRSEFISSHDKEKPLEKRKKQSQTSRPAKRVNSRLEQTRFHSISHKEIRSRLGFAIDRKLRSNFSTNNHKYRKRPLGFETKAPIHTVKSQYLQLGQQQI